MGWGLFVFIIWGKYDDLKEETSPDSHTMTIDCKGTIKLYGVRNVATRAEFIWVIKTISAVFIFKPSCEHIRQTFQFMFPNTVP